MSTAWRIGIVGAACLWLSYPALFVLAGIGVVVAGRAVTTPELRAPAAFAGLCWGISSALIYIISVRTLAANATLLEYWRSSFWPVAEPGALRWPLDALMAFVSDVAGVQPIFLGLVLAALGFAWLAWTRSGTAIVLTTPLLLTLFASAMDAYPFSGRLLLFATPCLFLTMAAGLTAGIHVWPKRIARLSWLPTVAVSLAVLYEPSKAAMSRLVEPRTPEHIRPAIGYMMSHRRSDDHLYVYYGAKPAFRFYARSLAVPSGGLTLGRAHRDEPQAYLAEIDAEGTTRRLWLLFSHECPFCPVPETNVILKGLDKRGRRLDQFETTGAATYLYELSAR